MTPQPHPEAVDATIAHFLPELTSLTDPTYEKNWVTVRALHFLSGALMWDTITAVATARRRELNDQELAVEQARRDLARAAA